MAKSYAQSKKQEKDKERVCKILVQNWELTQGAKDTAKLRPNSRSFLQSHSQEGDAVWTCCDALGVGLLVVR